MFNLSITELEKYIQDDIPYFDLTTSLQNCNDKKVELEVYTREEIVISCSEEAVKIAELLNCKVEFYLKSKEKALKNDVILKYTGFYEDVQKAWKLTQVLLEYSCKISTTAFLMKEEIEEVNQKCELLTTRKTFPLSKRFCIKAAVCGGAIPHRLGLSETILFFNAHRIIYKNNEEFYKAVEKIKINSSEKSVAVESDNAEDSKRLMQIGVDTIQLDKINFETLDDILKYKNVNYPKVRILLTGGINISNVKEFAKYPIDGIVTSSIYLNGMSDLSSRLKIIE